MIDKDKLLHYALENGIIDVSSIEYEIEMNKRKEYLARQNIWQGKNGRWYAYLPDERGKRKQVSKKNRKDLEDAIVDFWKEDDDNPRFEVLFLEWSEKKYKCGDIIESTYSRYLRDYKCYFSKFGKKRIRNISVMDIENFAKQEVHDKQLTKRGYGRITLILNGVFRMAYKKGYVDFRIKEVLEDIDFPRSAFYKVRKEDIERVFFTREEEIITAYLKDNPDLINLGLLLLFKTGLRVGELVSLKPSDVSGNKISITKTETRYYLNGEYHVEVREHPKTEAGIRTVILKPEHTEIIKQIRLLNPFGEWLFEKRGQRMKAEVFRRRLALLCRKLDIVPKSPHKIRATYGSKLYDSNVPKAVICKQMGHTDISCLEQNYYFNRFTEDEIEKAIMQISAL